MRLRNIYNHKHHKTTGFTLFEVLVVLALFALIASISIVFSLDSYRGYLYRSEHSTVLHLLMQARNRAMNNFNGEPHGVHLGTTGYTGFSGTTIADASESNTLERNTAITVSGATEIVFDQLSGNLLSCDANPCTITFSYAQFSKTIAINSHGGMTW